MSRLSPNQLTVRKVETAKDGCHSDGGNLWLTVSGKARTWSVRYTSPTTGKRREMGLGPFHDVTLAEAPTGTRRALSGDRSRSGPSKPVPSDTLPIRQPAGEIHGYPASGPVRSRGWRTRPSAR